MSPLAAEVLRDGWLGRIEAFGRRYTAGTVRDHREVRRCARLAAAMQAIIDRAAGQAA
jgi:hypothetical protein